jgi:hypothetical protein
MPTRTIQTLPTEVQKRLMQQVDRYRRCIMDEATWVLGPIRTSPRPSAEKMIARAQALNNRLGTTFDASLIERGKRKRCFEGYPDCCSGSLSEIELNEPNQSLLSCPNIPK